MQITIKSLLLKSLIVKYIFDSLLVILLVLFKERRKNIYCRLLINFMVSLMISI